MRAKKKTPPTSCTKLKLYHQMTWQESARKQKRHRRKAGTATLAAAWERMCTSQSALAPGLRPYVTRLAGRAAERWRNQSAAHLKDPAPHLTAGIEPNSCPTKWSICLRLITWHFANTLLILKNAAAGGLRNKSPGFSSYFEKHAANRISGCHRRYKQDRCWY